ncbi:MAG TPA: 4-vinyl reductase [Chloroflexia bacterium]|nr:4-vinyl reductase [Chloroflexia bacterium]
MEEMLSGHLVGVILEGVREISGTQYPKLLAQAGLTRFRDHLPPLDQQPAASAAEMGHFFGHVYTLLGEPITRLFLRNCGRAFVEAQMKVPAMQQMYALAQHQPPDKRLEWLVFATAEMSGKIGAPRRVSEDSTAWYHTLDFCYQCLEIRGVQAPICAMTESIGRRMGEQLLGHTIRVAEVECVAMGATHCKIAIYKERAPGR